MALSLSTKSLARASAIHPWRTVAIWVVGLVASFLLMGSLLSDALTNEQAITSKPESERGYDLLEQIRGPMKVDEAIVIRAESLTVDSPEYRSYVENIEQQIAGLGPDVVESSMSYFSTGAESLVSADRRTTLMPLIMAGDVDKAADNIPSVLHIVEEANGRDRFEVYSSGNASIGHDFGEAAERDLQRSEVGPLPVALIILILVFGAVLAAILPIVLAAFSILLALAATAVIGQAFEFSFFVTNMIVMMGLAVGIDYCLFIISRYREERGHGLEKIEALTTAGGTAGRAVLFSGLTVVIALSGLLIVPTTIFRSLAGGAILVVLAALAASLTLLPAVLSLMGDRVNSLRIPFIQHAQRESSEERPGGFWDRIARTVMRRPVLSVVLSAGLLVVLAIPYFGINLGIAGVNTLPDSFQSKQGFQILQSEFGGGEVYPADVLIAGDLNSEPVQAAMDDLRTLVASDTVFGPASFEANPDNSVGLIAFQMAADPNSDDAINAIKRLRGEYVPQAFDGVNAEVAVTGFAASNLDFFELTDQYTPIVFAFVLGLSFLVLMLVFRSLVVPAKAIVMNLLSVGAAYGLLVLVFQRGVGNEIFGFQQVDTIEAWLPLFLFSVLFGLSMDYHVFLLSRIRERYDQTGDNTDAVAFGLRSTGRLITGAALIMVTVFGGFAMGDLVMFQQMGFGLGVAVLIDATIIRSILVPASMRLLGRANWYLPPVLQWLPHVGIEGEPQQQRPVTLETNPR